MDKISELKEKLAKGSGYNIVSFEKGFDAAMELNNSFQLWLIDARNGIFADNTVLYFYEKGFPYLKNYHWLFNYWLENIYQPE